ncbi:uncharacterized protein LOC133734662 isoform X2 [Rosa rugosa]|uniref:uncharacterized protein LOC133734662 isoform X2 n=1 Tax=Rosa rugosa TaxID=74645 RepID=UPI002B40A252|nr:uncharacterized protein LOC133734662 isoform X2 [Rosa rugosa]
MFLDCSTANSKSLYNIFFVFSYSFAGTWKEAVHRACFLTFASMFDILSTWTSDHLGENSQVDYQAMVAQLEHQFLLRRLSLGWWYYCQGERLKSLFGHFSWLLYPI